MCVMCTLVRRAYAFVLMFMKNDVEPTFIEVFALILVVDENH